MVTSARMSTVNVSPTLTIELLDSIETEMPARAGLLAIECCERDTEENRIASHEALPPSSVFENRVVQSTRPGVRHFDSLILSHNTLTDVLIGPSVVAAPTLDGGGLAGLLPFSPPPVTCFWRR